MTLDVQFAAPSAFVVEFGTDADLAADLGQTTILSTAPQYKGETTVTPGAPTRRPAWKPKTS